MNIYEFYKEELEKKKTISSKKSFLTKSKKETEAHLKDLLLYKKPHSNMKYGYLHGEPVTPNRISKVKTELKVIEGLQKNLLQNSSLKVPSKVMKLVWKKYQDGGEIANYKMGSMIRYNKKYQINYFGTIGMVSENASSLANAKQKLDKISESKIKNQNGMKAPVKREFYGKLHAVKVIFANPKYNYETSVSATSTKETSKKYFVGKTFNVGSYPKEDLQKCTKIIFYKNPLIKNQNAMKAPVTKAPVTKAPAKRKKSISARTICRKVIDQPGISKRTGQLLKGWHYVKGKPTKVTKVKPVAKKKVAAKKPALKAPAKKQTAAQKAFAVNSAKARQLVKSGKVKTLKAAWALLKK